MNEKDAVNAPPKGARGGLRRRRALLALAGLLLLGGAGYGWYWNQVLRHYESTDNAYVQAPLVLITPQVGGTVVSVAVDDTDRVSAGQLLVRLDPADAQLELQRATAALAQTVREARTLYTNNAGSDAQVLLRRAEVERARSEVERATDDLRRRQPLVESGAVSGEDIQHAQSALAAARSVLAAAQSAQSAAEKQALSSRALIDGTPVDKQPAVQRAASAYREAWLNLQRTELRAPVAGQVARRTVQLGQRVAAGAPLMAVVELDQLWVEANFKEAQLRHMKVGQQVRLHADLYGDKVEYSGRIVGFGAGTGAAFALLPAQNATGNWIKVVQRVPVRIELSPAPLREHPLRVGLSMTATVDLAGGGVTDVRGVSKRVDAGDAAAEREREQQSRVDRRVQDIIAANLGSAARR